MAHPELLLVGGDSDERALVESAAAAAGYELVNADDALGAVVLLDTLDPRPTAVFACGSVPLHSLKELLAAVRKLGEVDDVEIVLHHSELDGERVRWGVEEGVFYFLASLSEPGLLRSIIRSSARTAQAIRRLARKVVEVEDTFRLLQSGCFTVRTPAEAELLAANLGSACEDPQQGIGLLELMINGIEHGNLGFSYDEKKDLLRRGAFSAEVQRRLASPEFADRHVNVTLSRSKGVLDVVIHDQGDGFDSSRYLSFDPERMFDPNGRGVALASICLDMEYVSPGNEVRIRLPVVDRSK